MGWNPVKQLAVSLDAATGQQVQQDDVAKIRGKTLWISSDYSFGNPDSEYDVVGLLLADPENSFGWEDCRRQVRSDTCATTTNGLEAA